MSSSRAKGLIVVLSQRTPRDIPEVLTLDTA